MERWRGSKVMPTAIPAVRRPSRSLDRRSGLRTNRAYMEQPSLSLLGKITLIALLGVPTVLWVGFLIYAACWVAGFV
jgi:hypothetical protein